jgi:hypothetical protein
MRMSMEMLAVLDRIIELNQGSLIREAIITTTRMISSISTEIIRVLTKNMMVEIPPS